MLGFVFNNTKTYSGIYQIYCLVRWDGDIQYHKNCIISDGKGTGIWTGE